MAICMVISWWATIKFRVTLFWTIPIYVGRMLGNQLNGLAWASTNSFFLKGVKILTDQLKTANAESLYDWPWEYMGICGHINIYSLVIHRNPGIWFDYRRNHGKFVFVLAAFWRFVFSEKRNLGRYLSAVFNHIRYIYIIWLNIDIITIYDSHIR